MYKLLLILKYLRRKLAPMFAALAVTLCTAMVIIVISVMGGFLQMWRDSAKKLSGEITISAGLTGFPHYEEMLGALRTHPDIHAASAIIGTFGILRIDNTVLKIEVVGIRPQELDQVVAYRESLYWTPERVEHDIRKNSPNPTTDPGPARRDRTGHWREYRHADLVEAGMTLQPPAQWQTDLPGLVTGIAVHPSSRDKEGEFTLYPFRYFERQVGNRAMANEMILTVMPLTETGAVLPEQAVKKFVVVNELKTGFIEFDANRVYIAFDTLQQMLQMQSFPITDENNQPTGQMSPARTSAILVKGRPGMALSALETSVIDAVLPVFQKHKLFGDADEQMYRELIGLRVQTWEEQHATILGAVEKEKFLLVFLFAIISLVAFVMVATTFYNIVLEKTRDVGVLRALGASHLGVAGLFLGYGLAIGVVGSLIGFLLAWGVVANLNEIQDFLEKDLGIAVYALFYFAGGILLAIALFMLLGAKVKSSVGRWRGWAAAAAPLLAVITGLIIVLNSPALLTWVRAKFSVKIWDAQIYYFDRIPAKLDWTEVSVIMIAAVLSAVLGSLIPAIVASRLDPVEAIRYE